MRNPYKTLVCVWIAGVLFVYSLLHGPRWLFIIAAFFDWLPLPTGWMKITGRARAPRVKKAGIIHGIVTVIAYIFGILWLIGVEPNNIIGVLFLETWFTAVILGSYTSIIILDQGNNS